MTPVSRFRTRRAAPTRRGAGRLALGWWLAIALLLGEHAATLHALGHAVSATRAVAATKAAEATSAAATAPVPNGVAAPDPAAVLDRCDECLLYAAFHGAAPAAPVMLPSAAAFLARVAHVEGLPLRRAPQLGFRSRAPPIRS